MNTVDGQTYDREAIENWLKENNTSPNTNMVLAQKFLIPNLSLRQEMQEFYDKNLHHWQKEENQKQFADEFNDFQKLKNITLASDRPSTSHGHAAGSPRNAILALRPELSISGLGHSPSAPLPTRSGSALHTSHVGHARPMTASVSTRSMPSTSSGHSRFPRHPLLANEADDTSSVPIWSLTGENSAVSGTTIQETMEHCVTANDHSSLIIFKCRGSSITPTLIEAALTQQLLVRGRSLCLGLQQEATLIQQIIPKKNLNNKSNPKDSDKIALALNRIAACLQDKRLPTYLLLNIREYIRTQFDQYNKTRHRKIRRIENAHYESQIHKDNEKAKCFTKYPPLKELPIVELLKDIDPNLTCNFRFFPTVTIPYRTQATPSPT